MVECGQFIALLRYPVAPLLYHPVTPPLYSPLQPLTPSLLTPHAIQHFAFLKEGFRFGIPDSVIMNCAVRYNLSEMARLVLNDFY